MATGTEDRTLMAEPPLGDLLIMLPAIADLQLQPSTAITPTDRPLTILPLERTPPDEPQLEPAASNAPKAASPAAPQPAALIPDPCLCIWSRRPQDSVGTVH